ncbi:MAG TPA: hypothetical protein VGK01_03990 [Candidatus Angelobacter sp.]|jgi:hypothetical protein
MTTKPENDHDFFAEALNDLSTTVNFALRVSEKIEGEPASVPSEMASMVHAKMCVNAFSAASLCWQEFFDHSGVLSLCRMVLEGMTMYFYLTEVCAPEEWKCRRLTMYLHDTCARIKLVRAFQKKDEYADLLEGRKDLTDRLKKDEFFQRLNEEQQKSLLSGEQIFVRGMRAAATRAAGWNEERFVSIYNYLSAYTHSAPMSFLRTRRHKIDYRDPSAAQLSMVRMALIVAQFCLLNVSLKYLDSSPPAKASFRASEIEEFEREVREAGLLTANPSGMP